MVSHYLIQYGEIALKGRNRSHFENILLEQIHRKCSPIAPLRIQKLLGRFWMEFAAPPNPQVLQKQLSKIFGLSNFLPSWRCEPSLEELKKNIELALCNNKFNSFAVRAKKCEPNFPVSSQYVNEQIGQFVKDLTHAQVNLDHPETTIYIEMFQNHLFYGFQKIAGLGGLPVGMSGKTMCLLSGGIDSPVAAWRMMKRGCQTDYIHFHSAPFTKEEAVDKVIDLAEALNAYQDGGRFFSVPFGEIQRTIVAKTPESYRVLLYRRMMLRIAEGLAKEYGCMALTTGESLSQVASQTMSNLAAIEKVVDLPIFRPLIGMDKVEIVDQARTIGTFDISIRPHEDCCSFMVPKHPKTSSKPEDLDALEQTLPIKEWLIESIKNSKRVEL